MPLWNTITVDTDVWLVFERGVRPPNWVPAGLCAVCDYGQWMSTISSKILTTQLSAELPPLHQGADDR